MHINASLRLGGSNKVRCSLEVWKCLNEKIKWLFLICCFTPLWYDFNIRIIHLIRVEPVNVSIVSTNEALLVKRFSDLISSEFTSLHGELVHVCLMCGDVKSDHKGLILFQLMETYRDDDLKFVKLRHKGSWDCDCSCIIQHIWTYCTMQSVSKLDVSVAAFPRMTKRALNRWTCFYPRLEVSALWLWMANYHRANGSRLSLLLVTWLYSSNMFFSLSNGRWQWSFSIGGNFSEFPPEVKHLLRGHKSFLHFEVNIAQTDTRP